MPNSNYKEYTLTQLSAGIEFCITIKMQNSPSMKAKRSTEKAREIEVQYDPEIGLLEIDICASKAISKLEFDRTIQEIECTLQIEKGLTLVFSTLDSDTQTMEFMLRVIKMIDRYEWLEGNEVKIHWKQKGTIDRERSRLRLANYLDAILQKAKVSYGALV